MSRRRSYLLFGLSYINASVYHKTLPAQMHIKSSINLCKQMFSTKFGKSEEDKKALIRLNNNKDFLKRDTLQAPANRLLSFSNSTFSPSTLIFFFGD